jgi:(p)ppGpp synthase/HD superfamily hydrolase
MTSSHYTPAPPAPELPGWIADAQAIATQAHQGQLRKGGEPYITHPAAVAAAVPDEFKPIAWLHDVVEDTPVRLADLRSAGLPPYVVDAVAVLTKSEGGDYDAYLQRVLANDHARRVKIADIRHNLSGLPSEKNRAKYTRALALLESGASR